MTNKNVYIRTGKGTKLIKKDFLIKNTIGKYPIKVGKDSITGEVFITDKGAHIAITNYEVSRYTDDCVIEFYYLKKGL